MRTLNGKISKFSRKLADIMIIYDEYLGGKYLQDFCNNIFQDTRPSQETTAPDMPIKYRRAKIYRLSDSIYIRQYALRRTASRKILSR